MQWCQVEADAESRRAQFLANELQVARAGCEAAQREGVGRSRALPVEAPAATLKKDAPKKPKGGLRNYGTWKLE